MANRTGKKRMTLSEHLALRAKVAEESKARDVERYRSVQALKELDKQVLCTCPACLRKKS